MDKIKKVIENNDNDIQVSVSCTQSTATRSTHCKRPRESQVNNNSNNNNAVVSSGSGPVEKRKGFTQLIVVIVDQYMLIFIFKVE